MNKQDVFIDLSNYNRAQHFKIYNLIKNSGDEIFAVRSFKDFNTTPDTQMLLFDPEYTQNRWIICSRNWLKHVKKIEVNFNELKEMMTREK